jgi:hypothetical protein
MATAPNVQIPEPQLPAAIRNQVAQADALQAALEAASGQVPAGHVPANQPLPRAPEFTPPPAPAPAPVAPPAPAPAPAPVPAPAPAPIDSALAAEIREMNRSIREQMQRTAPPPAPAPAPVANPDAVTPPEYKPANDKRMTELFGEDVLTMVDDKIRAALAPYNAVLERIERRFGSIQGEVATTQGRVQKTVENSVVATLDSAVPDWAQINVDPKFIMWLQEKDPIYNVPRQLALDKASGKPSGPNEPPGTPDVQHIIQIFKAYKSSVAPPPAPVQQPNPMESMIAPATVAGAAPAPAAETPFIKESEVKSFYDDVRKGAYRGNEAVMQHRMAAIDEAAKAGRIVRG